MKLLKRSENKKIIEIVRLHKKNSTQRKYIFATRLLHVNIQIGAIHKLRLTSKTGGYSNANDISLLANG